MNELVNGLRCDTFVLYAIIQHIIDQSFLAVSSCQKETFDRDAKKSQQNVHDAIPDAAGGLQKSFVGAGKVVN